MELQKNILLFFSGIDIPILNKLVEFITMFGETLVPLGIILLLLWCVDKRKGVISSMILFTADGFMFILKAIVRFPRPWALVPELRTGRIETATGYSFPSGHSTTASSFYSSIAFLFKKRALSIICAVLILLVPITRLYLCVHWPLDVFCGTVLGIGTTFVFFKWISKIYEKRAQYGKQIFSVGILITAIGFVMAMLVQAELIDALAFTDFYKNLAMLGGSLIGFEIEESVMGFSTEGSLKQKILRFVVGMAVAVGILEGVKAILPYIPAVSFFRYFAVTMWASMYPLIGKKLKLFN